MKTYLSNRDLPLICTQKEIAQPTLTVENYVKWYNLYLVMTDGTVEEVSIDLIKQFEIEFNLILLHNHCFNPLAIEKFADWCGWLLDDVSYEVIVGRWVIEVEENY